MTMEQLAAILGEPAVAGWWGERDADYVRDKIVGDPDATVWAIEAGGALVGLIQCYEEQTPSTATRPSTSSSPATCTAAGSARRPSACSRGTLSTTLGTIG